MKLFPLLEKLDMNNNYSDTLKGFPALENLKELHLANNNIYDITPLSKLKALEELDLTGNNPIANFAPLLSCPNLKKLTLSSISRRDDDFLHANLPNLTIIEGHIY